MIDQGFDISCYPKKISGIFINLSDYDTVSDLFEELTGNSVATYVSGAGIRVEDFEDIFEQEIKDILTYNIKLICKRDFDIDIDDDGFFDDYCKIMDFFADRLFDIKFLEKISKYNLKEFLALGK